MSIGRVVRHEIEDESDAASVQALCQLVEIIDCSEEWVDIGEIGNVVAEVLHGRTIDWRKPDGRHVKPGEMLEPRQHAGEIALAITVGVLERRGIDLIGDAPAPPR